jgi:Immunity protein 7
MYKMFAWFDIHRWANHDEDEGASDVPGMTAVRRRIDSMDWPSNTHIDCHDINWGTHVVMHSLHNHGGDVPAQIDSLISWLGETFPGTHGLIYEYDDEHPINVGDNAYRVRVMVRGVLTEAPDPYFSPINPTVGT